MTLFKRPVTYVLLFFLALAGALGYAVLHTFLAPPAAVVSVSLSSPKEQKKAPSASVSSHGGSADIAAHTHQGEGASHVSKVLGDKIPQSVEPQTPMPHPSAEGVGLGTQSAQLALSAPQGQANTPVPAPVSPQEPAAPPAPLASVPSHGAAAGSVPLSQGEGAENKGTTHVPLSSFVPPVEGNGQMGEGAAVVPPAPVAGPLHHVPPLKPGHLSLVVVGLGRQGDLLSQAMGLPKEVGLGFHAGQDVTPHQQEAQAKGFETFVMIPMEPLDYPQSDPGTETLLTGLGEADNVRRLHLHLEGRMPCMGVIPFMGSRFLFSTKDLTPVMQVLSQQKLIFMDTGVTSQSVAGQVAKQTHTDEIKATVVLSEGDMTPAQVKADFEHLEVLARTKKYLVVMVPARAMNLQGLLDWVATLQEKNITLVSVGSLFGRSNADLQGAPSPVPLSLAAQNTTVPSAAPSVQEIPTTPTPLSETHPAIVASQKGEAKASVKKKAAS